MDAVLTSLARAVSGFDLQPLIKTLMSLSEELPTMLDVLENQCPKGGDPKPQKQAGRKGVNHVYKSPNDSQKRDSYNSYAGQV